MASSQPLVEGGFIRDLATVPRDFLSLTPPDVNDRTHIVAVASPSLTKADPIEEDGWLLSDFYAFNTLFKGLGASQTWLTAADPNAVVSRYGPLLHGNPHQVRKVVLSKSLLESGKVAPVTVVAPGEMNERFLAEASAASTRAREGRGSVLLLVFCHGLSNFQFYVDCYSDKGISPVQLRGVLDKYVPVTLLTTACYSGGWVISPDLNNTVLDAAEANSLSDAWVNSRSVGRACGSIFASSYIMALTNTTTPEVDPRAEDVPSDPDATLQPPKPTDGQEQAYNAFCRSVWEFCTSRLRRRIGDEDGFSFAAHDDDWEAAWNRRMGTPLADFKQRWDSLEDCHYYQGSQIDKDNNDPSPLNPTFASGVAGETRTGGGQETDVAKELRDAYLCRRLSRAVEIFLEVHPGRWSGGLYRSTRGFLLARAEKGLPTVPREELEANGEFGVEDRRDAWAIMQFWTEEALLADHLVEYFRLPRPGNSFCLAWNYVQWRMGNAGDRAWPPLREKVMHTLVSSTFCQQPTMEQGYLVLHHVEYLAAALHESGKTEAEVDKITQDMIRCVHLLRTFHFKTTYRNVSNNEKVVRSAHAWHSSIGRKTAATLFKRKSTRNPGFKNLLAATSSASEGSSSAFTATLSPAKTRALMDASNPKE